MQRSRWAQLSRGTPPLHFGPGKYRGVIEDDTICEYWEIFEGGEQEQFLFYNVLHIIIHDKYSFKKVMFLS